MVDLKDLEFYKNIDWKEEKINDRKFVFPIDWELSNYENNIEMLKDTKKFKINSIDVLKEGFFPIIGQESKDNQGFQNDNTKTIKEAYIVFGDHTTIFKLLKKPFSIANDGIQVFKTKHNMNLNLLFYISKDRIIKNTGYNRHFKLLKEKYFISPNLLEEQEKIASILETQENLIDSKKELLEKYKKQRKYFQQELLSGRIRMKLNNKSMAEAFELGLIKQTFLNDANEVVEYGGDTITNVNIDIIDKDGFENWLSINFENKIEFYKNIDFKEEKINGRIINIPNDWLIDKIKNFKNIEIQNGFAFSSKELKSNTNNFLIKIGNIHNSKIIIKEENETVPEKDNKYLLEQNDLIIGMSGSDAGKSGVFNLLNKKCYLNQRNLRIRTKSNYFNFLYETILKKYLLQSVKSMGIPNLSHKNFEELDFYSPNNIIEQTLIGEQLTKIDNLIESLEEEIKLEDKKFTYLKQELLNGRIRVN